MLAVQRVLSNFNNAPEGLRKSAGQAEAARMAPIARAWAVTKSRIASKLPESLFRAEEPFLERSFFKGSFDDWLAKLVEECPAEVNVESLPEIRVLLSRHEESLQKARVQALSSRISHITTGLPENYRACGSF